MKNWTITRDCLKNNQGNYCPSVNVESVNGIDITIRLYKRYRREKAAMKAIEKILVKLPLKDIEEIKL